MYTQQDLQQHVQHCSKVIF